MTDPTVHGSVDDPVSGAFVPLTRFLVRGWAVVDGAPAGSVVVTTARGVIGAGRTGLPRDDVAAALGPDLADAGFEVVCRSDPGTEAGPCLLSVHVSAGPGRPLHHLSDIGVMLDAGGQTLFGDLNDPPPDTTCTDATLPVRGWALDGRAPVRRVEVLVDGVSRGLARLGMHRNDIKASYAGVPHASTSGWHTVVDVSPGPRPRTIVVEAVAETFDGERWSVGAQPVELEVEETDDELAHDLVVVRARDQDLAASVSTPERTDARTRVLVVTHDLGMGGGQLWLQELLLKMRVLRPDISFTVVSAGDGALRRELEANGIPVRVIGHPPVTDAMAYEGHVGELTLFAAALGFDAVFCNTFGSFPGADVAERLGLPCTWAIHESFPPHVFWDHAYGPGNHSPHVRAAAMRALAHASHVVFEADATRQLFLPATTGDAARVVHYGVDIAAIDTYCAEVDRAEAARLTGLDAARFTVLVMGTIESRKAQVPVAQAFSRIAREHPDVDLCFVGDTGSDYSDGLKELVAGTGLGHRVHVVRVVKDTRPWYRAADLLLCASDIESLPRTVIEAMVYGLPVLATSVFGLPELLTDGVDGFLFPDRDIVELGAALDRVLSLPPDALAKVAANARQKAVEELDSVGYARAFSELLTTKPRSDA
ncbi:MAG TPA: glycosyltransferase family 4 protein [Mycobacteriales bacterium]|nr:glycosyltransferase family 4 protein [Mycobacteriales bacterium]